MVRKVVTVLFQALLGLFMGYVAYTLIAWTPKLVTDVRDALNFPRPFWVLAGGLAVISAVALLVGLFSPRIGAFAALWTVAYFVVAASAHLYRADWANVYLPLTCLVLFLGLVALRWHDVKALPTLVRRA